MTRTTAPADPGDKGDDNDGKAKRKRPAPKRKARAAKRKRPAAKRRGRNYVAQRDLMAKRNREAAKSVRDIGELPAVERPDVREECRVNFRRFCEVYFPASFVLKWSPDHLKVIAKIERAVLLGGLFAVAMPRGSGKTTICQAAALWALLYGHRSFVALIGAELTSAGDNLHALRVELENNPELLRDFPEVCVPIRKLDGITQRRLLYKGRPVRMELTGTDIALPDMPGAPGSQGRVRVAGITGKIRGMNFKRSDGRNARPDLVIVDDPQTDESAKSLSQCQAREAIVSGAILGLAGPGRKIAGVMPCTVIRAGDMADRLLDPKIAPEWQGERCKMVYVWPIAEALWKRYANVREECLRDGRGIDDATAFYRTNQVAMDEGAVVGWPERFDPDEASALQNAYNLRLRDEVAFWSEYQNEPLPLNVGTETDPGPEVIAGKFNRRARGLCPIGVQHVTSFVDVQERLLYWAVVGWCPDFTGYVIDYGSFPGQGRPYFTYADARETLAHVLPVAGIEAQIYAGLEKLVDDLAARTFPREDGAGLKIERLVVDANYKSDTVYAYAAGSKYPALVVPSHGKYVGARSSPFAEYRKRPGDRVGHNWRMPNVQGRRAVRYLLFDTNYWKTFLVERFKVGLGGAGSLSLFGDNAAAHRMIAEHATAEFRTRTSGRGREVDEWSLRPGRPDNHLLDCLVGCCVAGSMQGVTLDGTMKSGADGRGRKVANVPDHLKRR